MWNKSNTPNGEAITLAGEKSKKGVESCGKGQDQGGTKEVNQNIINNAELWYH